MSYLALARKWRPQTFSDLIGQQSIVRTLQNAIEQERVHHGYLFSGVRGVGKTTAARIFAKALNCAKGPSPQPCNECSTCREITEGIDLDVREIDAATYTQVDNVRELREVSQFQPARDRYRIFIIDEAHMLSGAAWNALLKLIEEPPPHVIFIMATTEVQKVPATILSRVQRFVFQKVDREAVVARLEEICQQENIDAERGALEIIARRGEGSVRDSLSLLDQVIAFSGNRVETSNVTTILGLSGSHFFGRLSAQISEGDAAGVLESLEEANESGRDFKLLYRDLLGFLRNAMLLQSGARESILSAAPDEIVMLHEIAGRFEYTGLLQILALLIRDDDVVNRSEQQRLAVEIALLKAATLPRLRSIEEVLRGEKPAPPAPGVTRPPSPRTSAPPVRDDLQAGLPPPAPRASPVPVMASSEVAATSPEGAGQATLTGRIVEKVRAKSRLAGSYLEHAKDAEIQGEVVTFIFDAGDKVAIEHLSEADQTKLVGSAASEVCERPVTVRFAVVAHQNGSLARRDEDRPLVKDDPVLKSFNKHLGAELVMPSGTKRNREKR